MKIVLAIYSRNNSILQIDKTLKKMGHDVKVVYTDEYTQCCSYLSKKLDKLGFKSGRKAFEDGWKKSLLLLIDDFHPDMVLFVNLPGYMLLPKDLQKISSKTRVYIWFVDGIQDHPEYEAYYSYTDKIVVFELQDVEYLKRLNVKNVAYVPVGYSDVYDVGKNTNRTIDISFVGSPFKNRLEILEPLAKEAVKKGWNLKICGPFYETKYIWKKYVLRSKYPNVFKFLSNGSLLPSDVANIYAKSKIVLNIHDLKHNSPNPRTFDILASGALEIIDISDHFLDNIVHVKSLVEFCNVEDLIHKVNYYLSHTVERESIANYGKKHNIYSMEYSLNLILK